MKFRFLLLVVCAGFMQVTPAHAQADLPQADATSTKLQAFLGKRGTLLVRDFYDSGLISQKRDLDKADYKASKLYANSKEMSEDSKNPDGVYIINQSTIEITALAIYEPGNEKNKTKGLQVSLFNYVRNGSDDSLTFVDVDEARSLSKSLDYLLEAAKAWEGKDIGQKEVSFTTRDNLKVLLSKTGTDETSAYIQGGIIGKTSIRLSSTNDLQMMKLSVDKGISWLEKQ